MYLQVSGSLLQHESIFSNSNFIKQSLHNEAAVVISPTVNDDALDR